MEPELEKRIRGPVGGAVWTILRWIAPSHGETPNLFAASATVLPLAGIYLYFAGYIFAYFYYTIGFGVTLESLDLSPQYYLVQSYKGLYTVHGVLLLCGMLLVIMAYLGQRLNRTLILLALLGAFPALLSVSREEALRRLAVERCHPSAPTLRLHFKSQPDKKDAKSEPSGGTVAAAAAPGKDGPASTAAASTAAASTVAAEPRENTDEGLSALGNDGKLFLLLETKDRIVFFEMPDCSLLGDAAPPSVNVFTVLRSDLDFSMFNQN